MVSVNKTSGQEAAARLIGPKTDPRAAARFADAVRRAEGAKPLAPTAGESAADGAMAEPGAPGAGAPGKPEAARPAARPKTLERQEGEPGLQAAPRAGAQSVADPRPTLAAAIGSPTDGSAQPVAGATTGAGSAAGQSAAEAVLPKLAPRLPASFTLTFPPNAWPLLRAEGTRGPGGLTLRLTADAKDEARLKNAVSSLRDSLEAAGHEVEAIVVLTDGE